MTSPYKLLNALQFRGRFASNNASRRTLLADYLFTNYYVPTTNIAGYLIVAPRAGSVLYSGIEVTTPQNLPVGSFLAHYLTPTRRSFLDLLDEHGSLTFAAQLNPASALTTGYSIWEIPGVFGFGRQQAYLGSTANSATYAVLANLQSVYVTIDKAGDTVYMYAGIGSEDSPRAALTASIDSLVNTNYLIFGGRDRNLGSPATVVPPNVLGSRPGLRLRGVDFSLLSFENAEGDWKANWPSPAQVSLVNTPTTTTLSTWPSVFGSTVAFTGVPQTGIPSGYEATGASITISNYVPAGDKVLSLSVGGQDVEIADAEQRFVIPELASTDVQLVQINKIPNRRADFTGRFLAQARTESSGVNNIRAWGLLGSIGSNVLTHTMGNTDINLAPDSCGLASSFLWVHNSATSGTGYGQLFIPTSGVISVTNSVQFSPGPPGVRTSAYTYLVSRSANSTLSVGVNFRAASPPIPVRASLTEVQVVGSLRPDPHVPIVQANSTTTQLVRFSPNTFTVINLGGVATIPRNGLQRAFTLTMSNNLDTLAVLFDNTAGLRYFHATSTTTTTESVEYVDPSFDVIDGGAQTEGALSANSNYMFLITRDLRVQMVRVNAPGDLEIVYTTSEALTGYSLDTKTMIQPSGNGLLVTCHNVGNWFFYVDYENEYMVPYDLGDFNLIDFSPTSYTAFN